MQCSAVYRSPSTMSGPHSHRSSKTERTTCGSRHSLPHAIETASLTDHEASGTASARRSPPQVSRALSQYMCTFAALNDSTASSAAPGLNPHCRVVPGLEEYPTLSRCIVRRSAESKVDPPRSMWLPSCIVTSNPTQPVDPPSLPSHGRAPDSLSW